MRTVLTLGASLFVLAATVDGQKPPLLPEKDVAALANELSGETAKRNLEGIARFHRQRGSRGFHEAAELVAERLRAYGLSDVAILQFPPDGKVVVVSAQAGAVQDLGVGKFGAAGIVSYAQNQKTAWWGEDENLIRWGHLETFSANKTFGFMVSLKTARGLRERLAHGEKIRLHATVKAGQHAGNYEVVTATIPGGDPKLKEEEIAFSGHLDHQRPGANDNATWGARVL